MKHVATVEQLIARYDLKPHPEGGYFKETYRCDERIAQRALPERFRGDRSFSTAIYYLLPRGARSRLHRIRSDEVWHFYLGGPLVIVEIDANGETTSTLLSQETGHTLQHVVRAGVWFGAYPAPGTEYSLVGCTVAPGFDFADFEMADRAQLLMQYPRARVAIEQLTEP